MLKLITLKTNIATCHLEDLITIIAKRLPEMSRRFAIIRETINF